MTPEEAIRMSVTAHCGSCSRKVLLMQLKQPADGFRCPFCGVELAPGYASIAPDVAAKVLNAHRALAGALNELESITAGRLRLDRDSVVDPIAAALNGDRQSVHQ
jgi:hypothetical protein